MERRSRERCRYGETREINRGLIDEFNGTFKDALIIAVKTKYKTTVDSNAVIVDNLGCLTVLLWLIKAFLHLLDCRCRDRFKANKQSPTATLSGHFEQLAVTRNANG